MVNESRAILTVTVAALEEVATRNTEQKLSDHTCEYFFSIFFCSLVLLGGKFASNFQIIKQTDTLLFPLHTHTRTPQIRKRGRGTKVSEIYKLKFILCTLSHSLSFKVCVI